MASYLEVKFRVLIIRIFVSISYRQMSRASKRAQINAETEQFMLSVNKANQT